jgi:hypothetical protein
MGKLSMLIITLALGIPLGPMANAAPADVAVVQPVGQHTSLEQIDDCDSNYEGACVPVASDVDCAGGSGNGPEYVSGPVSVVGDDIYELDREGDGVACEPTQ